MKLHELSRDYAAAARKIRVALKNLRADCRASEDKEEQWHLRQKIMRLETVLTELNDLEEHTRRYYEKGFYRGKFGL